MPRPREVDLSVLPLRLFLAVVYLYAGFSKIADPRFLDSSSPRSLSASVAAVRHDTPIGALLGPVQAHSAAFGVLMAAAEIAVGLGVLLGLFTRVASAGGMVLALILWLSVSWHADPWFTSADLVYLVTFIPLLIAGAGAWSLDEWLLRNRLRSGSAAGDWTRRTVLASSVALLGAAVLGAAAVVRPSRRGTASAARGPQTLVPTGQVPLGGAVQVSAPDGAPVWVLQLRPGAFTAYDARCPHQGCAVLFQTADTGFVCPCHASRFDPTGHRLSGPASRGLTPIPVHAVGGDIQTI